MKRALFAALPLAFALSTNPSAAWEPDRAQALACGGMYGGYTVAVARRTAKCEWPFDVSSMRIGCNSLGRGIGEVYFESDKGVFALNGTAKATYASPDSLWLDAQDLSGLKVNVGPWIQVGLALCP